MGMMLTTHRGEGLFSHKRLHFIRIFQKYFHELCVIHRGADPRCQLDSGFFDQARII